jgi:hypothetical protein
MTTTDERAGVQLVHELPPEPAPEIVQLELDVARPPDVSVRGTVIPELEGCPELVAAPWLGLDLCFGPQVEIAEFGFYGPIKPLIDAMGPIFGRDHRGGPADHRLHDLRILYVRRTDGGVGVRFWYVE